MSDEFDDEIEIVGEEEEAAQQSAKDSKEKSAKQPESSEADLDQAEKYKRDYLYLLAEFENHKKNAIKERSQLIKYGNERLILQLLEVIDNFERALDMKVNPENLESFEKGMKMIHAELLNSLAKFGVTDSDPTGSPFDPQEHDALSSEETREMEPGHVYRVFRKAYKLHDKLIRPAQVVVAKEAASSSQENSDNEDSRE